MTRQKRLRTDGSDNSLFQQQTLLKAGQLSLIYENGSIRWIRLGDLEILRMIYSAVRDRNWGTIEPIILEEDIRIMKSSFEISLKVEYKSDPIHFVANYLISGSENHIRFELNGAAQSDFLKNRIGFCVLHPIRECAGKTATVIHSDVSKSEFIFPEQILAHQPIKNVQSIIWEPVPGVTSRLNLSGDIFEMEDQRNWTDASFKTYCTPLELPFPQEIRKGETVFQVVELKVEVANFHEKPASDFVFSWDSNKSYTLPELGTAICSQKETLTKQEANLLKKLPLKHFRVEIKMNMPGFRNDMVKATRECGLLGWPLFVVLYLSENYLNEYKAFCLLSRELKAAIKYLLPVGENHLSFAEFNELLPQIREDFPETLIGTGVNAYFAELNRSRLSIDQADFVSFTICPQVHAFDNASLVENLEAQAEVIKSAKLLFPDKPIFVSPVSLKQRFNVVATSAEPEPEPGKLPSSVDPRQRSVFAASWTLASLKFLAYTGANLATYYETIGWKGFMQGEQKPAIEKPFLAEANEIFPVYSVIKELSGYSTVVHSVSSHPLLFDGLVVSAENKLKMFLFNFTSEDIEIRTEPAIIYRTIDSLVYPTTPKFSAEKLILKAGDLVVIEL